MPADDPDDIRATIAATKPKRKQRGPNDLGSKTKQKGAPVVGNQAATLFGMPGAPKPGITKEAARLKVVNAEIAARLSNYMLESLEQIITDAIKRGVPEEVISMNTANNLALMRDAMDREYGKAGATVDLKSSDGSMTPSAAHSDAVLEALRRKHDPDA